MVRGIRDVAPFEGIETVLQPALVRSGAEFARLVYAYRAASLGARHLAIKSDDIWAHLDAIDDVLPERRVILLTRDFRDNVVSVTQKPFGPVDPVCAALYVKRRFAAYEAEYLRAGENGCIVRFETLVERADEFVRAMTAWCGLDAAEVADHALQTISIRPGRVGRWRAMPARAQRQSEALLQNELRTYGYPLAFADPQAPTKLELIAARARDVVGRVGQKTRRIGRSGARKRR